MEELEEGLQRRRGEECCLYRVLPVDHRRREIGGTPRDWKEPTVAAPNQNPGIILAPEDPTDAPGLTTGRMRFVGNGDGSPMECIMGCCLSWG